MRVCSTLASQVGVGSVVLALLGAAGCPAQAQSFNQFIAFGDSSIDSGWWKAYFAANSTNGNQNESNLIKNALATGMSKPVGFSNSSAGPPLPDLHARSVTATQ